MKRTQLWICLFATLLVGVASIYQPAYISAFILTFVYGIVALFVEENFESSPMKKTIGAITIIAYLVLLDMSLRRYGGF